VSSNPTLHEKKSLFEANIPDALKQSLRVVGCTRSVWNVAVPGSKSMTNRAIVLGAMTGRSLQLQSPLLADDTWWGFLALEQLGFRLDLSDLPNSVRVQPPQTAKGKIQNDRHAALIHVGQAGTLGRFIPAVLLNWKRIYPDSQLTHFMVTAHDQLARRPLAPLLSALTELNGKVESDVAAIPGSGDPKSFPLSVFVSDLRGACRVDSSSSGQFLSGVLMAAAGSRNDCMVTRSRSLVQPDYVRMTIRMLETFGVRLSCDRELNQIHIHPGEWTPPRAYTIEADASTACYYAALACVLKADVHIENLGLATLQPDFEFFSILEKFGFAVEVTEHGVKVYGSRGFSEGQSSLSLDLSRCSDQALTVGVMSVVTRRPVEVRGVAHIRHHESDRIKYFCQNCLSLGLEVSEFPDGFRVNSQRIADGLQGEWPTHHDHRFALSGLVLSAWAPGVCVLEPQCMQKTAPSLVAHLSSLGLLFDR
jgi:3-phosphoshikimate 1-carboxyvinyltransferase